MAGRRTADKGGDYKDADGNTFREVKSIRGGGRKTTKWVKVTREGEARPKQDNEDQDKGSAHTYKQQGDGERDCDENTTTAANDKDNGEEERRVYETGI